MTLLHNGLTRYHNFIKILFAFNLKHSIFWPLALLKPISNYLVQADKRYILMYNVYIMTINDYNDYKYIMYIYNVYNV
jgi:hypothetical protein